MFLLKSLSLGNIENVHVCYAFSFIEVLLIVDNIAIYLLTFTNCFFANKETDIPSEGQTVQNHYALAIWKIKHRGVSNTTDG